MNIWKGELFVNCEIEKTYTYYDYMYMYTPHTT